MAPEQLVAACDLAASIVHIPKETLALGMLHYHAITVADPLDEHRAARLALMAEAAELVHAIIDPDLDDDSDAEMPMPDAPEGAMSDPERVLVPMRDAEAAIDPANFVASLKRRFGRA
jgi:hypothetical protein